MIFAAAGCMAAVSMQGGKGGKGWQERDRIKPAARLPGRCKDGVFCPLSCCTGSILLTSGFLWRACRLSGIFAGCTLFGVIHPNSLV